MREPDNQASLFSYISLESRISEHHPIRKIRAVVDKAPTKMAPEFDAMYAASERPSIPPEQLIRALLLQIFFTIRFERQLVERPDYDLMFRRFFRLGMDDPV